MTSSTSVFNVLVLKHGEAALLVEIMTKHDLKGVRNIFRSKLGKLINSDLNDIDKERIALAERHARKDGEGKPLTHNGQYVFDDVSAFTKDLNDMLNDSLIVIDATADETKRSLIKFAWSLVDAMATSTGTDGISLTGPQAFLLDDLHQALQAAAVAPVLAVVEKPAE